MASALNGTGVTFNDASTQSTAAPTGVTTLGGVGNIMAVYLLSTTSQAANATIAGSSLFYPSSTPVLGSGGNYFVYTATNWNVQCLTATGNSGVFSTSQQIIYNRTGAGNLGVVVPTNCTALSGTWRLLGGVRGGGTSYDGAYGFYNASWFGVLAVRIS